MKVCSLGRRPAAGNVKVRQRWDKPNQSEFGTGKDGLIRIMPQILEELM